VLLGGHLYLVDSKGILKGADWNTGQEKRGQRGIDEPGRLIAAADAAGDRTWHQISVFKDNLT
jgi:hypothetical protein